MIDLKAPPFALLAERDMDLLMLEEMLSSAAFEHWLVEKLYAGMRKLYRTLGAWHTPSLAPLGCVDILFVFEDAETKRRCAILIENKIDQPKQNLQAQRYFEYGEKGVQDGVWDEYLTCLFSPQAYFSSLEPSEYFSSYLSYEEIEEWFSRPAIESRNATPERAVYKKTLVRQAINQAMGIMNQQRQYQKQQLSQNQGQSLPQPPAQDQAQGQTLQQPQPQPQLQGQPLAQGQLQPQTQGQPLAQGQLQGHGVPQAQTQPLQQAQTQPLSHQTYLGAPQNQGEIIKNEKLGEGLMPSSSVPYAPMPQELTTPQTIPQPTAQPIPQPTAQPLNANQISSNPTNPMNPANPTPALTPKKRVSHSDFRIFPGGVFNLPSGYREAEDTFIGKFFNEMLSFSNQYYPHLGMKKPSGSAGEAAWVEFSPPDFPREVAIIHKMPQGFIDLSFAMTPLSMIQTPYQPYMEGDMTFKESGKTAIIRINIFPLNPQDGFEAQKDQIALSLQKAQKLYQLYLHVVNKNASGKGYSLQELYL